MDATRGSWGLVEHGLYVRDKNQKTWRVEQISTDRVRLVDRHGTELDIRRPPDNQHVTILRPTEEEVRFTMAKALGARILGVRGNGDGSYKCPSDWAFDLAATLWHLDRFHRITVDRVEDVNLPKLVALHDADHDPAVPHEHTEDL